MNRQNIYFPKKSHWNLFRTDFRPENEMMNENNQFRIFYQIVRWQHWGCSLLPCPSNPFQDNSGERPGKLPSKLIQYISILRHQSFQGQRLWWLWWCQWTSSHRPALRMLSWEWKKQNLPDTSMEQKPSCKYFVKVNFYHRTMNTNPYNSINNTRGPRFCSET